MFCHYFVKHKKMGIKGIGLALALANIICFFGLNIYPLFVKGARRAFQMPTKDALKNIREYLRKGLPLSFMLFFEWLSFEIMILMSGALGVAE